MPDGSQKLCCWQFAPGRVSQGKLVLGKGQDKVRVKYPDDDGKFRERSYLAYVREPGVSPGVGKGRCRAPDGRTISHWVQQGTA